MKGELSIDGKSMGIVDAEIDLGLKTSNEPIIKGTPTMTFKNVTLKASDIPRDHGIPITHIVKDALPFFIHKKRDARAMLKRCPWSGGKLKPIFVQPENGFRRDGFCIILPGGFIYCVTEHGSPRAFKPPEAAK